MPAPAVQVKARPRIDDPRSAFVSGAYSIASRREPRQRDAIDSDGDAPKACGGPPPADLRRTIRKVHQNERNDKPHRPARRMANAIRFLAADAVEKAKSGHPGLPMG